MLNYLAVGIGSALGGMARYWCSLTIARLFGEAFPWGTLIVNVTGCFAIGLFFTLTNPGGRPLVSLPGRLFFMTGICGGYTTFSAFSLQTFNLMRGGDWMQAGLNAVGSLVLCLVAVWLGHIAAELFNAN